MEHDSVVDKEGGERHGSASGSVRSLIPRAARWSVKPAALFLTALLIGVLDDVQVRYLDIDRLGSGAEIAYQVGFMSAAALASFLVLRNGHWGRVRNLSSLLMAIPVATMADNVSIDAGTLKLYILLIPRQGYEWRDAVFARVPALSQTAGWVNTQSVASGLINGYVVAIGIMAGYVVLQYVWWRKSRASTSTETHLDTLRSPPRAVADS